MDEDEFEGESPGLPQAARIGPVTGDQAGQRLDVFLATALEGATRSEAQRLIELPESDPDGVRVNGRRVKANYRLRAGDNITVSRPAPRPASLQAEAIPLSVVYEDADLLVIDKARGMVVHPAPGAASGTLVNAV